MHGFRSRRFASSVLFVAGVALASASSGPVLTGPVLQPSLAQLRLAKGFALPQRAGATSSLNWSGYAVRAQRGKPISAVSSAFQVPAAGLVPPGFAATWTGIGGMATPDLIQAGVAEQSLPSGLFGDQYFAWYELLPASLTQITRCAGLSSCAVNPGDRMTVSIRRIRPSTWLITITDGRRWHWSKLVRYPSSGSSAEWILEAPAVAGVQTVLAPVGTAHFGPVSSYAVAGKSYRLGQGRPTRVELGLAVVNEATPSGIARDGQSFNVCAYSPSCPTP